LFHSRFRQLKLHYKVGAPEAASEIV